MARISDPVKRLALLDEVVAYLASHGLGLLSMRPLAAYLDVSTNRLVHHFGSKEDLVSAALARAEELQLVVRDGWLAKDPKLSQAELLRKWWVWLNRSSRILALVRLGLEAVAIDATASGVPGDVRARQIGVWRVEIEQGLTRAGLSASEAEIEASIVKAIFTGLVLDLIASGDRQRLSAALEVSLARLESRVLQP